MSGKNYEIFSAGGGERPALLLFLQRFVLRAP
jgi:hypothetical protein